MFAETEQRNLWSAKPLAARMRPRNLEEFVGQRDFIGPGKLLWRMLKADRLTSLIFYGPPGTGKTALAHVIAQLSSAEFVPANAATIGVAQIRKILSAAQNHLATGQGKTVLFLDEIHRFSKSQQDVLLNDVEHGTVILVGATTENPFFSVNSALVSRSTMFEFQTLSEDDLAILIRQAASDRDRGLGKFNVQITDDAVEYLALMSNGDARRALTALEVGVYSQLNLQQDRQKQKQQNQEQVLQKRDEQKQNEPEQDLKSAGAGENNTKGSTPPEPALVFDKDLAVESIQQKSLVADRQGDTHYDIASALQKSMRGSDPDATVYWLARLLVGGEDPRFIARRIAVCAAEDVGNADPMATVLAAAAVQISEFVGLPEAQLPLAQAAIYIACAPKSNRSAQAVWQASKDVREGRTAAVPDHLRDAHYAGAKKLGRGQGYHYPHSQPDGYVPQDYLPQEFAKKYYEPTNRGTEQKMGEYLAKLEKIKSQLRKTNNS